MMLVDWLTDPHIWASFIALSAMEIVLGIDNVVFISLLVSRLPPEQRLMARRIGLSLALVFRVIMLGGITWIIHLTHADFQHRRLRLLVARPHPDRRRPVPVGQGHARDPSGHRRRGERRGEPAPSPTP